MSRQPPLPPSDGLEPYAQALRARVPSREALLAEARADLARRAKRKRALAGTALTALLLGGIWLADPCLGYREIRVAHDGRQVLQPVDGSTIELDAGSVLRVQWHLRSRQYELVSGEGLFRVAHGPAPFIVHSQGVSVRDIGTVFDVRSDRRGVQVVVLEGAVLVDNGHARQPLKAPEQMLAGPEGLGAPQAADLRAVQAWRSDLFHFQGTPLDVVIGQLQRHRSAPVRLLGGEGMEHRLSGDFPVAGVESLIDTLPQLVPVKVQREAGGAVTLVLKK